jgi:DNA-binding transcriptional ArsR family regulator
MTKPFHHPLPEQITLTGILHALSDPIRRQIVMRLLESKTLSCSGACTVLPPSTLSFHCRVLRESGLVHSQKNGTSVENTLRRKDIEGRFPGLLRAILKHHQSITIAPPPATAKAKK